MRVLDARGSAEARAIAEAVAVLRAGGIVAYPTETFYALGAKYDSPDALARLYRLKGRAEDKPASLIVGGVEDISEVARDISPQARGLMRMYWPGALTLVLAAREGLQPYLTAHGTVAVRVPGESFALRLAREAGFPITATSANPAGMPPPADAPSVARYFPDGIEVLVDGGPTPGGEPSTIAVVTGSCVRVVREGAVKVE
jgi:L-threonylcarbamoyladenylate synthase